LKSCCTDLKTHSGKVLEFHTDPHIALYTAAVKGNLEEVPGLVEAGRALDYFNNSSQLKGYSIEHGICMNMSDYEGVTQPDIVVRKRFLHAVNEFLERDPIKRPELLDYLTKWLYDELECNN
jgi:hypothetical protein